jgi:5-deoxy-5-amino-3-dehydroquinate synthase
VTALHCVNVPLGDRSYDVVVGHGAIAALPSLLPARAKKVAIVTQDNIEFARSIKIDREHRVFTIGAGEAHKNLSTIEALCRSFAAWGMNRADVVVGVGGGIVTDVAGFAASVFGRGLSVLHVSTTLLGMIDAAIGGKTGVNLAEGKNLVGAFWQPSGVICDLDALATLPERELRCGYGEMAKYHFLTGDDLLAMELDERVARCVAIKAGFVATDERESISSDNRTGRALLNYGHTLGHALEIATAHRLLHGEAVAIGLVFAARLAAVLGRVPTDRVLAHEEVARAYGLSTLLPPEGSPAELVALMARDKKAIDGLTFVLDGSAGIEVVPGVSVDAIRQALSEMKR